MTSFLFGVLTIALIATTNASAFVSDSQMFETLSHSQLENEKTHFEALGDLYKVGVTPSMSKISNMAWAGRCFSEKNGNEPMNGGFILRKKKGSETGPVGENLISYESLLYWKKTAAPNYFDALTLSQVYALKLGLVPFPTVLKEDSIEVNIDSTQKSNFRISGNYLVEEMTGFVNDVGPIGRVTVGARCYYFISNL